MKPEIRFKGFEGEWTLHPLKEFARKMIEKNTTRLYNETFTNSAEFGVISQRDFFDHDISNDNNISGYYLIHSDDFVYNPRISVTAPVGPINRNLLNRVGVMSPLYFIFRVDGVDKDYLGYFFKTTLWHKYMLIHGNAGARFDRLSIADDKFLDMPIVLPKDSAEQQKIGDYFKALGCQITLQTDRLEKLKQIKAASLQSMFPQEGETAPRIRFKGFEGEWKEEKAGSLFKTFNEKNCPDLPVLSATQDKGMVPRDSIGYNIFHDKSNEATYKHILPGQFVIHLRSFQGGFAHSSVEGIASPAYTVLDFKNKEENHDYFWKYIFSSREFVRRLELITYGIRDGRSINFDEFAEMIFLTPSKAEQQKIADYFKTLDRQVTLQTRRLEKLKQIKAACLDKMFV